MANLQPLKIGELTAPIPVIQGGMGVGISLSGEAVAFHRAGKTVAFNFSLHVHIVAGFENFIE